MDIDHGDEVPAQAASRRAENEIRITSSGKETHYISYALSLFDGAQDTVLLTAMGGAINKSITVCEILKRRVPGLHQWNAIESRGKDDKEGESDKDGASRMVSYMTITLSTNPDTMARTDALGYQPPISADLVMSEAGRGRSSDRGKDRGRRDRGGRGRGRKPNSAQQTAERTQT